MASKAEFAIGDVVVIVGPLTDDVSGSPSPGFDDVMAQMARTREEHMVVLIDFDGCVKLDRSTGALSYWWHPDWLAHVRVEMI